MGVAMVATKQIRIDDELHALIPPLSDQELAQLQVNLMRDGCLDPLIVWMETGIILDGRNRKEICDKHGIGYRITEISLPDREAAQDWIDAHQLGRRNLTPEQASLFRGRRYERLKKGHGGGRKVDGNLTQKTAPEFKNTQKSPRNTNEFSSGQNVHLKPKTAESLAAEHGVNERTMRRDGQFVRAVEKLKSVDPDIERKVATGKGPAKERIVRAAKEKSPAKAKAILEEKPVVKPTPEPDPSPIDELGVALPDNKACREAFAARPTYDDLMRQLSSIKGAVRKLHNESSYLHLQQIEADLTNARREISSARPHAVCPHCQGRGGNCLACKGVMFITELMYERTPEDIRKAFLKKNGVKS